MTFQQGNSSKLRHGFARRGQQSAEYQCWQSIKQRCFYPKHAKFEYYGGRGITICDRWRCSFEDFLADVGPRPSPKHSIDRYPNRRGNYEPGNVRWATRQQQADNRDSTRWLTLNGEVVSLAETCRRFNVDRRLVGQRLIRGWPTEKAVMTPRLFLRRRA